MNKEILKRMGRQALIGLSFIFTATIFVVAFAFYPRITVSIFVAAGLIFLITIWYKIVKDDIETEKSSKKIKEFFK